MTQRSHAPWASGSATPVMATLPRTASCRRAQDSGRPASWYDNLPLPPAVGPSSPSQAMALSTTVPQNIAAPVISGRHAPTRHSLRHSRLVVQARCSVLLKQRLFRHHRLAKSLCGLQLLVGAALSTMSVWLLLWAPSLRHRDVPYWCGGPVFLSGFCGLIIVSCCHKDPKTSSLFSVKVASGALSLVGSGASLVAAVLTALHLRFLGAARCEPDRALAVGCECRGSLADEAETRCYADLSCPAVRSVLSVLLLGACALASLGLALCGWFLLLHCLDGRSRPRAPGYSRVLASRAA